MTVIKRESTRTNSFCFWIPNST